MNRILIFSHFNPHNDFSAHVLFALEKLRPFFRKVVFISNPELKEGDEKQVQQCCDRIVISENTASDFEALKNALLDEKWDELKSYDQLVLMNDTCFGPLFDMTQVFENMNLPGIDFWGLINPLNQDKRKSLPGKTGHGYRRGCFQCFNKKIICSPVFQSFWEKHSFKANGNYESGIYGPELTRLLIRAGFHFSSYKDAKSVNSGERIPSRLRRDGVSEQRNKEVLDGIGFLAGSAARSFNSGEADPVACCPDVLLQRGVPFIKVDDFLSFDHPKYLVKLIEKVSDYPVRLIEEYINKTFNPNVSIKILNKNLFVSSGIKKRENKNSVAVHLHVYYIPVFRRILDRLLKNGEGISPFHHH